MNKQQKTALFAVVFIALIIFFVVVKNPFTLNPLDITYNGKIVKQVVPLTNTISCTKLDTIVKSITIPKDGIWISKQTIGGYTDGVSNIKVIVDNSWLTAYLRSLLGGGTRIIYQVHDQNLQNPASPVTQNILGGTNYLSSLPNILDVRKNSVYIAIQARSTVLSSWANIDSVSTLSYAFDQYGLKSISPINGINTVCSTGCDLSCPDYGVRKLILANQANTVEFNHDVNYIATWVEVSNIAEQLGGTVWNPSRQQFCFGGFIYSAAEISTQTGDTYIYPKTYLYKKDCCIGATISTTYQDKICQSDYTWKTIDKGTVIKCSSDFNCPNQGLPTCQSKTLSGWSCSGSDPAIGKFCEKASGSSVACCINTDCPSDFICSNDNKCVMGSVTPPQECTSSADCASGLVCSSGKCISKTICTADTDCENGFICTLGKCVNSQTKCAWYNIPCQISNFLRYLNNLLNIIKGIGIAILVIFSFIVSKNFLSEGVLKGNKNKIYVLLISILFAVAIFVLFYTIFFTALFWIISIIALAVLVLIKVVPTFLRI